MCGASVRVTEVRGSPSQRVLTRPMVNSRFPDSRTTERPDNRESLFAYGTPTFRIFQIDAFSGFGGLSLFP